VRNLLFATYVVSCLLALTWPGYGLFGNRIEPYVLGIPFSLAWVLCWVGLTFAVLVLYHTTRPRTGTGTGTGTAS
jgi:hypothetical protein